MGSDRLSSPVARCRTRLHAAAALAVLLASAPASLARHEDPVLNAPLKQWLADGPVAQIPWKVKISAGGLSYHQRLEGIIDVRVDGREVVNRPHEGSLTCLVRITDEQGSIYEEHDELDLGNVTADTARSDVQFLFAPYVVPGVYKVQVFLWHSKSGEHNLAERSLQIEPLSKDPLPEADANLPRVEFNKSTQQALEDTYQPDVRGRLHLRLATAQPVHLDLLADVTPGGRGSYSRGLALLLPLLKTLSQIEVTNGSVDVAAIDLLHQRVTFEQEGLDVLDWKRLRSVLASGDPGVVGVRELQSRTQQAAFFREEMRRRLAPPEGTKMQGTVRAVILMGNWFGFEEGNDLTPLAAPADSNCLVFYLRIMPMSYIEGRVLSIKSWKDDLERILAPLKPRVYEIDTPLSERKALADILHRISLAGASMPYRP